MIHKYLLGIVLFAALISGQDEVCNIIVMDLFGQYVTEKDLHELTVTLEKELRKTGRFIIHKRERIQEVLDEYGVEQEECRTIPWIVRIGKKLGMDKVVLGSVNNLGRTITVHVRTIDMEMKEIDRSATVVCHDCSIDVIFLKKIKIIAKKLAGLEVSDQPDDSLFHFKSGPLVELEEREEDSEVQKQLKEKLFEDWRRPEIRRKYNIGMFLYTAGASLFLLNDIIWMFMDPPPETSKRLPIVFIETGFAFLAIPFLNKVFKSPAREEFPFTDDSKKQGIAKGVKIGVSVSRINPSTYESEDRYKTKTGINIGFFLTLYMNNFFVFQPELHFVQKGFISEAGAPNNGTKKLNYMEVPLLFKGHLPLSGRFKPNVLLGLSPSVLLKDNTDRSNFSDPLPDVSWFDLGLYYGLELNWELPKGTLVIELNNIEGLIDLNKDSSRKNRSVSVLAGYSF